MSPSNSLTSNTYQNRAQYNIASIQQLKVNNLLQNNLLQNNQDDNNTIDDELLVQITLNILNAILLSDRIIFTLDNLVLNQLSSKLIIGLGVNMYTEHYDGEAVEILKKIFEETGYEKNVIFSLSNNFTENYYATLTNLTSNENEYTLYFKNELNSQKLTTSEKVNFKTTVYTFNPLNFFIIQGNNVLDMRNNFYNDPNLTITINFSGLLVGGFNNTEIIGRTPIYFDNKNLDENFTVRNLTDTGFFNIFRIRDRVVYQETEKFYYLRYVTIPNIKWNNEIIRVNDFVNFEPESDSDITIERQVNYFSVQDGTIRINFIVNNLTNRRNSWIIISRHENNNDRRLTYYGYSEKKQNYESFYVTIQSVTSTQ